LYEDEIDLRILFRFAAVVSGMIVAAVAFCALMTFIVILSAAGV
jgi:hypothetical protein